MSKKSCNFAAKLEKCAHMSYIKSFYINNLWGYKNIHWDIINPDVNIIVGINGSGKTTLLNTMYSYYNGKVRSTSTFSPDKGSVYTGYKGVPEALEPSVPIIYLRSLDNLPLRDKRKNDSQLLQELNAVVYQNAAGSPSFFGYRMRMLDYTNEASHIQNRIDHFFLVVNKLFEDSQKILEIKDSQLVVKQNNEYLSLDKLSSGEKQMLLITLKTFLTLEQPAVLFMDEPEISMHITWQNQLIDVLRELNPQAQLFLTTHSPSVLSKGWGDKITYMEDITD